MTSWPVLDRQPVVLPTLPGHDDALWSALIELTELRPGECTELVPVEFGSSRGLVPRPSLLGAIISKAVAVDVDDLPDSQRLDLAVLPSLVDDPAGMAGELTAKDRKRLRTRAEVADPDQRAWVRPTPDTADRGRAAYRLLIG